VREVNVGEILSDGHELRGFKKRKSKTGKKKLGKVQEAGG